LAPLRVLPLVLFSEGGVQQGKGSKKGATNEEGWDDCHDVKPQRGKALRQEDRGQDRQLESKRHRGLTGYGNLQSRSRVR
jgi:hypothetical protein